MCHFWEKILSVLFFWKRQNTKAWLEEKIDHIPVWFYSGFHCLESVGSWAVSVAQWIVFAVSIWGSPSHSWWRPLFFETSSIGEGSWGWKRFDEQTIGSKSQSSLGPWSKLCSCRSRLSGDVLVAAETGSGKTGAFGWGLRFQKHLRIGAQMSMIAENTTEPGEREDGPKPLATPESPKQIVTPLEMDFVTPEQ